MMNLIVKPRKGSKEIVSVTPASAGWRYISFSAYQLAAGETLDLSDNSNELCAVVLSGIVSAETEGHSWKEIGGSNERLRRRRSRMQSTSHPAQSSPSPPKTAAELGVAGGPAKGELPARLDRASGDAAQRTRQGLQYALCLRHSPPR